MAGRAGLLLRHEVRGLGRHACMLACRGRSRLLLMMVDMNMSGARKSRKATRGSKYDHRKALADICLHKASLQHALLLWKRHHHCTNYSLTWTRVHFHTHIAHVSGKRGHRKPLRHMTAGKSAVFGRLLRSPVKRREAL